jgi:hypothetical protein
MRRSAVILVSAGLFLIQLSLRGQAQTLEQQFADVFASMLIDEYRDGDTGGASTCLKASVGRSHHQKRRFRLAIHKLPNTNIELGSTLP